MAPASISAGNMLSAPLGGAAQSPAQKPSAVSPSNFAPPRPASLTTKNWVVPPRPKPGRKPAVDTAPSKRKAQNRAAQRAFRERRAARVGELEEEIKKIEEEDREEQDALRAHIDQMDKEIEELRTNLNTWVQRCQGLEAELAKERLLRQEAPRPENKSSLAASSFTSPSPGDPPQQPESQGNAEPLGCGKCSSISNCECIQAIIDMPSLDTSVGMAAPVSGKRPHSPIGNSLESKRFKPGDLETDFTNSFQQQQSHGFEGGQHPSPTSSSALADPCGFCADGTACICAEMQAAEGSTTNRQNHDQQSRDRHQVGFNNLDNRCLSETSTFPSLHDISTVSRITPPPSETDVTLSTSSSQPCQRQFSASMQRNSCTNGPGTCQQCRSDPNSTLFCKSLAKSREQQLQQPESKVVQNSSKTSTANPHKKADNVKHETLPSDGRSQAITISCADAYTTLSRHPGYTRAMSKGQMSVWMPRLLPSLPAIEPDSGNQSDCYDEIDAACPGRKPVPHSTQQHPSQGQSPPPPPAMMDIDAAEVMAVLREFDRRFV